MLVPHESLVATLSGNLSASHLEVQSLFPSQKTAPNLEHKQAEKEGGKGKSAAHTLGASTSSFFFAF